MNNICVLLGVIMWVHICVWDVNEGARVCEYIAGVCVYIFEGAFECACEYVSVWVWGLELVRVCVSVYVSEYKCEHVWLCMSVWRVSE